MKYAPLRMLAVTLILAGSQGVHAGGLFVTVDLAKGEAVDVNLTDGSTASVELIDVEESRGNVWHEVNRAAVVLKVNGVEVTIESGMYRLPQTVGGVQVDCPVTRAVQDHSHIDWWTLEKDARLRIWPGDSPWITDGTFVYPVRQEWFASQTWFTNEPVSVRPDGKLYYHSGLDIGGAEGLVDVLAATDARIVSLGTDVLPGHEMDSPVEPRYDVIYLLDERGWYYRYSHLQSFVEGLKLGDRVAMGQQIGTLGKEGASGGWSHLHFEIKSRQPSGRWGTLDSYAFLWQAYLQQYSPNVIAVARPGHVIFAGESVQHDATRSWTSADHIASYEWTFSDGTTAVGPTPMHAYEKPGAYRETLKVTDSDGNVDYDFVRVTVYDPTHPDRTPAALHAAFSPTFDIHAGTPVAFKVRAFQTTHGEETWDFGDGSDTVTAQSDGNVDPRNKNGYAVTTHRYKKPGDYLVHVKRIDEHGHTAEDRLHVRVQP
ncbi:MAG: PKD domain-containing protein [Planctomycetaceae bacterium]|nr:PKD domain-containing protein [Planctomycetaceae bacterium]